MELQTLVEEKEIKMENKKAICRVCLSYDCEKFAQGLSIFEELNDVYVYEKINYVASIKIETDDNLPDRICSVCLIGLENACNFKQLCEKSDTFLHSTSHSGEPQQVMETENPIKEEEEEFDYNIYPENSPNILESNQENSLKLSEFKQVHNTTHNEKIVENPIKEEEEEFDYNIYPLNSPNILESNQENSLELSEFKQEDNTTHNEETVVLEFKAKPDFVSKAIDLKLECDDCGGTFKSKFRLQVHWKKVHMPEKLKCSNCKQKFKSYKALQNHIKKKSLTCVNASKVRVEGEGKFRTYHCKDCDASSNLIQTIVAHLVRHTGEKPFKCDLCNQSFTQLSSVRAHKENVHKKYNEEVTCSICGKLLQGRSKWSRHMSFHRNKRETCPVCKKTYASKVNMENHMKRHSGVKSYACEICAKTFYCGTDLSNHRQKTHLKSKIYECKKCEYKSLSYSSMSKHRVKHTLANVACEICGRFVDNEQQLVLHKERHSEKNAICPYCDKGFFNRKLLSNHTRKKHPLYDAGTNINDKTKITKKLKRTA